MSAVRIRVYEDQFEHLQVEVDGRKLLPGSTVYALIDNVDVAAYVRSLLKALSQDPSGVLDNTEVTT